MKLPGDIKGIAKYLTYGLYNTVLVTPLDILAMRSVTNWGFMNSSGLIFAYNAAFTGLRLIPPVILYLKNRSIPEFLSYLQAFCITLPGQDAFEYGVLGMNPMSPFGNMSWGKPNCYPWAGMWISVRDYFATYLGLGAALEPIKRKVKKYVDWKKTMGEGITLPKQNSLTQSSSHPGGSDTEAAEISI